MFLQRSAIAAARRAVPRAIARRTLRVRAKAYRVVFKVRRQGRGKYKLRV